MLNLAKNLYMGCYYNKRARTTNFRRQDVVLGPDTYKINGTQQARHNSNSKKPLCWHTFMSLNLPSITLHGSTASYVCMYMIISTG